MTRQELAAQIRLKKSYLCIGLDTDITKIPTHLLSEEDPLFAFNKQIIDATLPYAVSYKINTAFYEAHGSNGWKSLEKTIAYLPETVFTIADAKRGDIGNTTDMYAKAFFESMSFDAITVAPYMGADSVTPFLKYKGKWTIILALTSNPSSNDFQMQLLQNSNTALYKQVITTTSQLGTAANTMYVVGATQTEELAAIRALIPDHFLLIPGVGAQGGSLEEVSKLGLNKDGGLLVNSSRAIIYASSSNDFAEAAAHAARQMQQEMALYLAS